MPRRTQLSNLTELIENLYNADLFRAFMRLSYVEYIITRYAMKMRLSGIVRRDKPMKISETGIKMNRVYSILRANWFHLRERRKIAGSPKIRLTMFRGGGSMIMQPYRG